ncbi:acetate uptake transporter family protein [Aspergillus candidus]|uniref:GPR/FUN34 family protein n=1 Tax=Aspergillus candidus TaxID=41067 RepID=A0A2I2FL97_ASPCN|nr:GPR/FUN34 family protein [Aspergillus candidus]PLB41374.1 GPR/FUN34 family protein [Aspergillus candidus]
MADTTEKYDLANTTTNGSSPLQQTQTKPASAPYENGHYGPLAHVNTAEYRLPAFGGEFQPGLYRSPKNRKIGNPAPLGLCAFALTTFILGCIQMQVRGITQPNIIVGSAFGYGGLVQLLAGMWEMAVGNTFGATVLSSYGGFWISVGITFTPGGFEVMSSLEKVDGGQTNMFYDSFGLTIMGWFIFTTIMLFCTFKSTVAFFTLFLVVDIALLLLGLAYLLRTPTGMPNPNLSQAGGFFAILGAFLAWYNAFAGIADDSNSFILPPVVHFPWSEKGREARLEKQKSAVSTGAV